MAIVVTIEYCWRVEQPAPVSAQGKGDGKDKGKGDGKKGGDPPWVSSIGRSDKEFFEK